MFGTSKFGGTNTVLQFSNGLDSSNLISFSATAGQIDSPNFSASFPSLKRDPRFSKYESLRDHSDNDLDKKINDPEGAEEVAKNLSTIVSKLTDGEKICFNAFYENRNASFLEQKRKDIKWVESFVYNWKPCVELLRATIGVDKDPFSDESLTKDVTSICGKLSFILKPMVEGGFKDPGAHLQLPKNNHRDSKDMDLSLSSSQNVHSSDMHSETALLNDNPQPHAPPDNVISKPYFSSNPDIMQFFSPGYQIASLTPQSSCSARECQNFDMASLSLDEVTILCMQQQLSFTMQQMLMAIIMGHKSNMNFSM